ncbi:MAG: hypothetical protein FWD53_09335 [Phycisphaerales bacterium]|nr:hypothetical protein [Phycisphaerales bacterium]
MKNALDFIYTSCYLERADFIQRFASAYLFLEAANDPAAIFYDPEIGGKCFNCVKNSKKKHSCKMDKTAARRSGFFFLFNTMCGNSSVRRRFDGTPTEMQMLIGDTEEEGYGRGTDYVADFLFGYTGYDYKKCTDASAFKREIIASIDAGRPVIAKAKSGFPRFYVITGYDGDALVIPEYIYYDFATNSSVEKMEKPPGFDEIDVLYLFGKKIARRYTLRNGLKNIRRVMEYNIKAGLWDEYLKKLGGSDQFPSDDGLVSAAPEEKKVRANHWAKTNVYIYNFCSFGGIFDCEKLPNHYLHKELFDPALSELWGEIHKHWGIVDAGHKTGKLNREKIWEIDDPAKIAALSTEICEAVVKIKEADIQLLEIMKQAISVLEKRAREESFKKHLSGALLINSLDFARWMDETSGWTHSDEGVCFTVTDPGNFYLFVYGPGSSVCNSDFNDYPMSDEMKEFVHANVNHCNYIKSGGKECGCREKRWRSFTILGRKYDNLCYCCICFKNPDLETFNKIKELVPVWKRCIDAAKQVAK